MTVMIALLYVAVGVGCGLIRLSAIAVGIIAMIPAVVGAFVVAGDLGVGAVVVAALVPLLVIQGAYFVTMLVVGKWSSDKSPEVKTESRSSPEDIRIGKKPTLHGKP